MYDNPDLDNAYGYNVYVYSKIRSMEELIAYDIEALEAALDDKEFTDSMDDMHWPSHKVEFLN